MAKQIPAFTYENCVACGICAQACIVSALTLSRIGTDEYKKAYPELNGRPCTGCGQCGKACPMGAVAMEDGA